MEEKINLITTSKKKTTVKRSLFFNAAMGFLAVTVVISVIVTLITFYLNSRISIITTNQNTVVANSIMGESDSKRVRLQTIHDRLGSIKDIVSSDKQFDKRLKFIVDTIPAGIDIISFQVDKDTANVSISSNNLSVLNNLFEKNLKQAVSTPNGNIKSVTIDGFNLEKSTLSYTTNIKFTFKSSL